MALVLDIVVYVESANNFVKNIEFPKNLRTEKEIKTYFKGSTVNNAYIITDEGYKDTFFSKVV